MSNAINTKIKIKDVSRYAGSVLAIGALSVYAFPRKIAYEIFKRDKGTCQISGKRYKDGWRLDAAHYDHERNGNYTDPENGRMLGVLEHAREHFEKGETGNAILICNRALFNGLRYDYVYGKNPELREVDNKSVFDLAREFGISPGSTFRSYIEMNDPSD